jgi:hypothetical protein
MLKQKRFYLNAHAKLLKINQENPENQFNLGIKRLLQALTFP